MPIDVKNALKNLSTESFRERSIYTFLSRH